MIVFGTLVPGYGICPGLGHLNVLQWNHTGATPWDHFTSGGVDLVRVTLRFSLMLQGFQINDRVCTRTDVPDANEEAKNI